MEILYNVIVGLAMGIVFGVALEKSRVFEPGVMVGQMQLQNFIMLKIFISAVATGLIVLTFMTGFGDVALKTKATYYLPNIIGGLIFGAGIVIAGACPGTMMAQIGAGYKDAWAVLAGGIFGAMAYGYLEPVLTPIFFAGSAGKLTLYGISNVPFWVLAPIVAIALTGLLVAMEKWRPWRDEIGVNVDGLKS